MRIKRIIYCILGFIFLGLGCLGIFIPVLPTVPFLILTSFFFSRGSKKFDDWFHNTKIYKKHLENFQKNKVMTLKGEVLLLSFVTAMLVFAMRKVDNIYMSITLLILICVKYLYFIFCIKTVTKEEYKNLRGKLNAR